MITHDDTLLKNTPPHDLESERAVLGACLLDELAYDVVAPVLAEADFYRSTHGTIFRAVRELRDASQPVDTVSLATHLRDRKLLDAIGGASEIAELTGAVPTSANAEFYARRVREKADLRRAIEAVSLAQRDLYDESRPAHERLSLAEKRVFDATAPRHAATAPTDIADVLREAFDLAELAKTGRTRGIAYGIPSLDRITGGLPPGEMAVVGARPSVGKSAFALNVARNVARAGVPVVFFSMEMPRVELGLNLMCSLASVDSRLPREGRMTPAQHESLLDAGEQLARVPLTIDEIPDRSPISLRSKARRLAAEGRAGVVIVDYLQLLDPPHHARASRQEIVAEVSRTLKALAVELKIPVLALAQLNRESEGRPDQRPRLSDLRESGAIEADAAVVLLLHRDMKPGNESSEASVIVAKNRYGRTGDVDLFFDRTTSFWGELERRPIVPGERPRAGRDRWEEGRE